MGIGKVSPGARCQPCRHHPPWLAPPRAKTLLHLPLGRLQLMPGVLSTHLLVTCRNGPCGRHRSLPVLSKTRRQRRSCHHDSHVAERSHHARRAPGNSPSAPSKVPKPSRKRGSAQYLYLLQNLPVGSTSMPGREVWAREACGSGAEGEWPDWKPLSQQQEGGGELACCCSSSKVFWPLRKLPQSSLITRENNGKNLI